MMGSMGGNQAGGAPMPDANKMQEMMQNPSISKFIDNPEFLHSTVEMLKAPAAYNAKALTAGISDKAPRKKDVA